MSSLSPFEEIAIKKGSTAVTLQAKQAQSARLQAHLDTYLAAGGQIELPQSHSGEAKPFNRGETLSVSAGKNSSFKFEVKPAGKPKMSNAESTALGRVSRVTNIEKKRNDMVQAMRVCGRPVTTAQLVNLLEMKLETARKYIVILLKEGRIEIHSRAGNSVLYVCSAN